MQVHLRGQSDQPTVGLRSPRVFPGVPPMAPGQVSWDEAPHRNTRVELGKHMWVLSAPASPTKTGGLLLSPRGQSQALNGHR